MQALNTMAESRDQRLAQMTITWSLNNNAVATGLIGASHPAQIENSVAALNTLELSPQELAKIDEILA